MLTSIIFDFSHLKMRIQSVKNLSYLASLNNSYDISFFLKVNLWLVVTLKGCLFGNTDQILQESRVHKVSAAICQALSWSVDRHSHFYVAVCSIIFFFSKCASWSVATNNLVLAA